MEQSRNRTYLSAAALSSILAAGGLTAKAADATAAGAAEPQKPKWETSAFVGATLTSGNSDTLLITGNILTQRKWDKNELSLGADGTYGENEGDKNNESVHGFIQYNRLFTERFYGYARADALHDGIAEVDYRVTLSPGVGYYFIQNDRTKLSAEFGPGAVFEKLAGVESQYWTLRFGERFEHKLSKVARVWQSLEYLPQVDDFGNYVLNAELGLEAALTEKLSLNTFVQDTYRSEPAPGREENDLKWVTGVKYRF